MYSSGIPAKDLIFFCLETLFMSAFFRLDKDFHPVFIDYCLMSHPDYTVQAIHLSTTHCRPFVAWNVCVCVFLNICLLPVNDMAVCVCLFVNAQHIHVPPNNMLVPKPCSRSALIFCFTNGKASLHQREKLPSCLETVSLINEQILCSLWAHPIQDYDKYSHHVVDLCLVLLLQIHDFKTEA